MAGCGCGSKKGGKCGAKKANADKNNDANKKDK